MYEAMKWFNRTLCCLVGRKEDGKLEENGRKQEEVRKDNGKEFSVFYHLGKSNECFAFREKSEAAKIAKMFAS